MSAEKTDIELISHALTEFNAVEAGLAALRTQYAGVVYPVDTTAGMDDAKAARLALREPRYAIERIRKEAKAPLLAIGKKLDADAKRITAEIEKIEGPIDQQIKAEEARKEAEKQAKIAAEIKRVQDIQERIAELRGNQTLTPASGPGLIAKHISDLTAIAVDGSFEEFREQAESAKLAGLDRLRNLHIAAVAYETEQARLAAEREELARLRVEQAERDRLDRERLQAEARAAKEAQVKAEQEAAEILRKEREAIAAERRQQEAHAQAAREAQARIEREAADKLRQDRERLDAERAAMEREQEALRRAEESRKAAIAAAKTTHRPTDAEIIEAVAAHFGVSKGVAAGWLASMKAAA